MTDAPIFIVGTPRSGTTLTARILDLHSRLFMPGETHFMEDLYFRRDELGPPTGAAALEKLRSLYGRYNEPPDQDRVDGLWRDGGFVARLTEGVTTYPELFQRFMSEQMTSVGKRRWGNNVPRDLFCVDELLELFPGAKIICCVRDVRDFLASYRDRWRTTAAYDVERIQKLYHPVVTSFLWRSSMIRVLDLVDRLPPDQVYLSRYEQLVGDPEAHTQALCAFIGEPFEPAMLRVRSHNSATAEKDPGIFTSSVQKWRRELSDVEVYFAQKVAGRLLDRFGYERADVRPPTRTVIATALATPAALYRALDANQHMRGNIIPYLWRRVSGLMASSARGREA